MSFEPGGVALDVVPLNGDDSSGGLFIYLTALDASALAPAGILLQLGTLGTAILFRVPPDNALLPVPPDNTVFYVPQESGS